MRYFFTSYPVPFLNFIWRTFLEYKVAPFLLLKGGTKGEKDRCLEAIS